ncbi:MAG: pyruvate:ferredoxin (flavodoxin) oxidoreductase [Lentisphaerae bacterium GWF2_57_35]|nr:MAG: pyruvate:ferredoxin (flavodoxin) oxidoreductase [Lentisphaerae bacterium GWF2_57_35]
MVKNIAIIDGNEAAAYVAHKTNEVCAIYPITPSSNMGEWADQWSSEGRKNIWGTVPAVAELQSEGGASGAVHGALQTGALTTTFTASQGLLLMIPNMYKIAGELTSTVFHVSARSLACQGLSIFGDHSDVMATRQTGFAMLVSNSVQEVMDMALISQAATLEARVPFIHFFDGFRTSHEVNKMQMLEDEQIRAMIDDKLVFAHRQRGLTPDRPVMRGTAQNPDVYFQGRETVNPFYTATPEIVQKAMDKFAQVAGRQYKLFQYIGAPDADRIVILMGSSAEVALETINFLQKTGEKVGAVVVHLYRPFSIKHLLAAIPPTVKSIAVLDRTKEPGSEGEPLYKDVVTALSEALAAGTLPTQGMPKVIGGRYGLSSKEFTPAMVKGVLDELKKDKPKNHFVVGIKDDVTNSSIDFDPNFITEPASVVRSMFFGLGSDGTVGANKNSIKIIGEETDFHAQGYFVYDSKKAGSRTVSHLRFGPDPIHSPYLIQAANFIGCHQFVFLEQVDVLKYAAEGSVFLLNSQYDQNEVWDKLPRKVQEQIIAKKVKFYSIDGYKVAQQTGMGNRVNTIMQTCFFAISGVLPRDEAIEQIKKAIKKTYGKKGEEIVKKNYTAVDQTLANLHEIKVPAQATSQIQMPPTVSPNAPEFVQNVTAEIMAGRGDDLPVSAMPVDGTFPTGTTKWEKRNISLFVPVWEADMCIQCGNCSLVCPHGVIRCKTYDKANLAKAPKTFKSAPYKGPGVPEGTMYTLQSYVEDCTGCGLCIEVCPKKAKDDASKRAVNMAEKTPILEAERENIAFFESLPDVDRTKLNLNMVKDVQFAEPLFEFSGACAGCGETPYIKLLSQLFGDRAIVANATGCTSIYGGNLPTTPWTKNKAGRGPAWSNSLFEDNAEFGYGFRLTVDKHREFAGELIEQLKGDIGAELADAVLNASQKTEKEIADQRARVAELKAKLQGNGKPEAKQLLSLADHLVKRSVWIIGGDGWAYDIGYGGLDHVLASGRNVNILVLDTEVYSNTGGQMSKATPRGAVAKFAAGGKNANKKDLAMMAMSYGNVYVAKICMGANPMQTIKAFQEAEAHEGPSLIVAYAHCIAHGINMQKGLDQQKLAVQSGHWILSRYNPALAEKGENPFVIDSKAPSIALKDYAYNETRYKMLTLSKPDEAAKLMTQAQKDTDDGWKLYQRMANPAGTVQ